MRFFIPLRSIQNDYIIFPVILSPPFLADEESKTFLSCFLRFFLAFGESEWQFHFSTVILRSPADRQTTKNLKQFYFYEILHSTSLHSEWLHKSCNACKIYLSQIPQIYADYFCILNTSYIFFSFTFSLRTLTLSVFFNHKVHKGFHKVPRRIKSLCPFVLNFVSLRGKNNLKTIPLFKKSIALHIIWNSADLLEII